MHSAGLRSAYQALKYTYEDPEVAFLCPHELQPPSTEASPAHVLGDNFMRCTQCKKMTYRLEDVHKDQLSACCKLEGEIPTYSIPPNNTCMHAVSQFST